MSYDNADGNVGEGGPEAGIGAGEILPGIIILTEKE